MSSRASPLGACLGDAILPVCIGHSLGAAVATLDATMLRMQLPSNIEVDSVVFGLPRVGNQQFADMIDSLVCSHVSL